MHCGTWSEVGGPCTAMCCSWGRPSPAANVLVRVTRYAVSCGRFCSFHGSYRNSVAGVKPEAVEDAFRLAGEFMWVLGGGDMLSVWVAAQLHMCTHNHPCSLSILTSAYNEQVLGCSLWRTTMYSVRLAVGIWLHILLNDDSDSRWRSGPTAGSVVRRH